MSDYAYYKSTAPEREPGVIRTEPLPDGDYDFSVIRVDEPRLASSGSGNLVLKLTIQIEVEGKPWVYANPYAEPWRDSPDRKDRIGEFLCAIDREPEEGEEPDWQALVGAKGRCRLKKVLKTIGVMAGREDNEVAFFHRPKRIAKPQATKPEEVTVPEDDEPLDV